MEKNPQTKRSYAQVSSQGQRIVCHKCQKEGHKQRDCPSGGSRKSRGEEAVAKSARDAVAEAEGLKLALQEKQKELVDVLADKKAHDEAEAAAEKEAAERLKAELAQMSLMDRITLGSGRISPLWMMVTLLFAFGLLLLRSFLEHFLWWPLVMIRRISTLTFILGGTPVLGMSMSRHTRFLIACGTIALFQIVLLSAYYNQVITKLLCLIGLLPSFFFSAATCFQGIVRTWLLVMRSRTCPKKVWVRMPGLFGMIALADNRDDNVNSVPLRHAKDHLVKYAVFSIHPVISWVFNFLQCFVIAVLGALDIKVNLENLAIYCIENGIWTTLCTKIELLISASLASQVMSPRNTPTSLPMSDVGALVERAAASEGYSNVNRFQCHGTLGNLRMNTKEYVLAVHTCYREEMSEAGF